MDTFCPLTQKSCRKDCVFIFGERCAIGSLATIFGEIIANNLLDLTDEVAAIREEIEAINKNTNRRC